MTASAASAAFCQNALNNVGGGVGASLRAVDCAAAEMAQSAFGRLFASGGTLTMALTAVLTIFIAFIGFGLITGRSRISLTSLTPRMMTLVLVIAFATSWLVYQSTVYNLAVGAPDQIARMLMGTKGAATDVFADKIDVVFGALIQATGDQAMGDGASVFSPSGLMWLGGTLLLLGTVGVLATSKIALAVLMALGPIFIVMALFNGTRGLFVGWLKGVILLAITPLFAVLGGTMMLELAVPVISNLAPIPGQIDPRSAMAFFMIGAVHAALMIMVVKVAATMVGGWTIFGLASNEKSDDGQSYQSGRSPDLSNPAPAPLPALIPAAASQNSSGSGDPSRNIRVTASTPAAANDAGHSHTTREVRILSGGASGNDRGGGQTASRTHGIGSRFRPASSAKTATFTSAKPPSEKLS